MTLKDIKGNLFSLVGKKLDTLASLVSISDFELVAAVDFSEGSKLLFSFEDGIFQLSNTGITPWEKADNKLLSKVQLEQVIHYKELRLFCLASKGSGVVVMDYKGNIVRTIETQEGLGSNTCYNLFRDANNDLWACMDNGFARIEFPSTLSFYDKMYGLSGIVNNVVQFKNNIYVGTTNGLYYLSEENTFVQMSIPDEVWDLKVIDDVIWAAGSSGLYSINNLNVEVIADEETRAIYRSSKKDRIWIGLSHGLGIVTKKNGKWNFTKKIKGLDHEVRTIAIEDDSVVWCSYEKVSRLSFNTRLDEAVLIQTMDSSNGFSEDFFITECYNIHDNILFGTAMGLYEYDSDQATFIPNTSLGERFADGTHEAWALSEDSNKNVWIMSNGIVGKLKFKNNIIQHWDTLAFARLKSTDVWRIVPIPNKNLVYFCTTDGLYRYDQNVEKNYDITYNALINKVEVNRDSVISFLETEDNNKGNILPYSLNDLRFSFAATSYNYDEKLMFSFLLDGYDDEWSSWVEEPIKEYTNLPHGKYTFSVKAKNLYGIESKEASYIFKITPPWYQTKWAYSMSLLLLISGVLVVDRIQRKRLFKRQQTKLRAQEEELERERQISNKLRKVDKLKDEFLANTSHELRTPLNGIIGISESLYEDIQDDNEKESRFNLAMVIASGKRLSSLVDSILDYSKLKTHNLELKRKPVSLNSIVKIVLTMSRPLISSDRLRLVNNVPEDLPLINADENRLQQILYNLVGNAIKFTESGKISVSAWPHEEFVEVEVKDNGVGIPEDKLDTIFDSFEQLNSEVDRDYIGTGLGLSISKKLVELHNGSIKVSSKVGEGSVFTFTIPMSLSESPSWIESKIIEEDDAASSPQTIKVENARYNMLVVDDEPVNRKVLANQLKNELVNIDMAGSGAEALELMDRNSYDMVLLDVMMPQMSGYEVCGKIREKYTLSQLPVIFITAKDQVIDLVEGLRYGANDYITKPFSKQEFLARLRTHLNLLKINDSYSRFIPYEFLQSLGKENIMEVNLGDQIEKEVTILFTDIRDYTSLSEGMSPKENFEFLNAFLSQIGPIVRKNRGFVMQYLGDGLMSIFVHEPGDAIRASVEMLSQIESYNLARVTKARNQISVGIGMHTGKLMLGVIGDNKRMDVNVVSDSVNTASRMEGLTKHYGASTIMSERTLNAMKSKNEVNYRFLGLVKVKGKNKPLKIYEVLDGLSAQDKKLKVDTKELFENGLNYYFRMDFINAASEFKKVTTMNKSDLSAQMYLKLSAKFMVETVPENWTGVETMRLK